MMTSRPVSFLTRTLKGIVIALGFILPGVSGGVLAAILGLYERLLGFMAHPKQRWREDLPFFLPVGLGGVLGVALLSAPLAYLLTHAQVIVLWGFAGAIIGTLPSLMATATHHTSRDWLDWTWLLGTLIIGGLGLYNVGHLGTLPANFIGFIIAGSLIALGVLVPGLSPSNLLLILGLFSPMLLGFKNLDLLGVFLPIALGGLITMAVLAKGIDYLITHHHSRVYHFIIGLVIASTALILIPNETAVESISYAGTTPLVWGASLLAAGAGVALGWWMSRLEAKYK